MLAITLVTILNVAAHFEKSASTLVKERMKELDGKVDVKWALEAIQYQSEIPQEVKVALKQKQRKHIRASLIQGHDQQPDADTMVKLNRARELLNKMYEKNQQELDEVIWDCRTYLNGQQELIDENTRLRTMLGAAAARAKAMGLEASAKIKEATNELEEVGGALEKHNGECEETLGSLRAQEAVLALDYEAGMMIQNSTEKTCDAQAAAASLVTVRVKTCKTTGHEDEDGDDVSYEFEKEDFQDMEAHFQTPLAKAAMHRMLKLSIEQQEEDEESDHDFNLLQMFDRKHIRERRLAKVPSPAPKAVDEETAPAPAPGMEAKDESKDLPARPKCSTDDANCPVLLDQVSTMVGEILDGLQQIRKQLAEMEAYCKDTTAKYEGQIAEWSAIKDEENVKLAEAIETENTNSEALRQKVIEYTALKGAYDRKKATCDAKKTEILNTLCGIKIVRLEVYHNEGVEEILMQDCEVGDWVDNDCDATCGGGKQSVTREILQEAGPTENPGAKCPPVTLYQDCNAQACPIDCIMEDWSEWGACSKDCGGGVKAKARSVNLEAKNGGAACGETDAAEVCNVGACDVDCVLAPWGGWDKCAKACNGGIEIRRKPVFEEARGMGKCIDEDSEHRFEERECNKDACPPNLVCNAKVDILLVLDGSGSVRTKGFAATKSMAHRLVERLEMGENGAKVGVIRFSKKIDVISMMSFDQAAVLSGIDAMDFPRRTTSTSLALSTALDVLKAGGRKDVEKRSTIVFLLTDGRPNNAEATASMAEQVRGAARLVVVPVGRGMGKAGLEAMVSWASFPQEENVLHAQDYNALAGLVSTFIADLCKDLTCRETTTEADMSDYIGCQTQTVEGLSCGVWDTITEEDWSSSETSYLLKKKRRRYTPEATEANILGGHNYCRNPGKKTGGIWCFTTSIETPWAYCEPRAANATGW